MNTLLTIDDQRDNLTVIKAIVKNYMPEWHVLTALTGEDGISLARKEQLDIILLDIIMPGMDGFEVLKELKAYKTTCNIPVIAVTARAMKEDREMFLSAGFDDYISKPIDLDVLYKTIEKWT